MPLKLRKAHARWEGKQTQPALGGTTSLAENHRALLNNEPVHADMVRSIRPEEYALKSGHNNPKMADWITAGRWKGMPLFTLTLPELATCPLSCPLRSKCYGKAMPDAIRYVVDDALYAALTLELRLRSLEYPAGFAVRLHVLGDFVDERYLKFWLGKMEEHPALHVFGFTAHPRGNPLGDRIDRAWSDRWRVRISNDVTPKRSAHTLKWDGTPLSEMLETDLGALICPEERHTKRNCAECGMCWSSDISIAFIEH